MSCTTSIRCDEALKSEATEVAEFYGFDLSSVTRAFWAQMARTKTIPLDLYDGVRFRAACDTAYNAEVTPDGTVILPSDWEKYLD